MHWSVILRAAIVALSILFAGGVLRVVIASGLAARPRGALGALMETLSGIMFQAGTAGFGLVGLKLDANVSFRVCLLEVMLILCQLDSRITKTTVTATLESLGLFSSQQSMEC